MEEKLNQILKNQEVIIAYLIEILKQNKNQFTEDYAANLLAMMTEKIFYGRI